MTTDDANAIRIAANEVRLRELNEQTNQSLAGTNPPFPDWMCECGDPTCLKPLQLSVDEYEAVRESPIRFIVAPSAEHVSPNVERVVQRAERYWVIEKLAVGAAMSETLDPRSPDEPSAA